MVILTLLLCQSTTTWATRPIMYQGIKFNVFVWEFKNLKIVKKLKVLNKKY
jgi:hypothetical protein